ncbi:hypothetical protein [Anaplasma marginale]|uniref:hypothetical protein n=1 Tax=Anaplasma marginale TaxID=770 RepID=UPI0001B467C6|nr:hypothetical protein [Anaplasma marginale]
MTVKPRPLVEQLNSRAKPKTKAKTNKRAVPRGQTLLNPTKAPLFRSNLQIQAMGPVTPERRPQQGVELRNESTLPVEKPCGEAAVRNLHER